MRLDYSHDPRMNQKERLVTSFENESNVAISNNYEE